MNIQEIYQQTKNNYNYLIQEINHKWQNESIPGNLILVSYTPKSHHRLFKLISDLSYTRQTFYLEQPLFIGLFAKTDNYYYLTAFYFYEQINKLNNFINQHNCGESCMLTVSYHQFFTDINLAFKESLNSFFCTAFQTHFANPHQIWKYTVEELPQPTIREMDNAIPHNLMRQYQDIIYEKRISHICQLKNVLSTKLI